MNTAKAKDERVHMLQEARAFATLPQVAIALAAAFISAAILSMAFSIDTSAGFSTIDSAWADVAYAVESSDQDQGDSASELTVEETDDQAANVETDTDDASDEETVVEEIEDDEVPMAQAIGVGRNIQFVIVAGVATAVIAFILFMRRMKRSMDGMRRRFRS